MSDRRPASTAVHASMMSAATSSLFFDSPSRATSGRAE
jgi:hypothetical protein